ncbi:hypothetical protein JXQ31_13120 [candidate division KSB1 bacterium]|nr:hypothetical protein [candidate division KSB1 bacterium]
MLNLILSICDNLLTFFSNIIGVLLGAFIAICTIRYQHKIDKEKELIDWFQGIYVFNTIDPIHSYFSFIIDKDLGNVSIEDKELLKLSEFDYDQINRLKLLLFEHSTPDLSKWAIALIFKVRYDFEKPKENMNTVEYTEFITKPTLLIIYLLRELREELLKYKLQSKADIYKIQHNKFVKEKLEKINKWWKQFDTENNELDKN